MHNKDYCRSPHSLDEWQRENSENERPIIVERCAELTDNPPTRKPWGKLIRGHKSEWFVITVDAWGNVRAYGPLLESIAELSLALDLKRERKKYYENRGT